MHSFGVFVAFGAAGSLVSSILGEINRPRGGFRLVFSWSQPDPGKPHLWYLGGFLWFQLGGGAPGSGSGLVFCGSSRAWWAREWFSTGFLWSRLRQALPGLVFDCVFLGFA